jgi:Ca2+-binding RTX toxin-like protein
VLIEVSAALTGITALNWTESGAEHDNVQCANVLGGAGDDTITGDTRANVLRGGGGGDTLNGAGGNDSLYGEAGADFLYGGAGDDTLAGADGIDALFGGDDNDVLEGDAGNDVFNCDGKNSSSATSAGTAPGDADFKVDYASGDTQASPVDCEF